MNMTAEASIPEAPILVLNSGSSSLKFSIFSPGDTDEKLLLSGSAEGIGRNDGKLRIKQADGTTLLDEEHLLETQEQALKKLAEQIQKHPDIAPAPVAVGHRVVHGGPKLRQHQRITPELLKQLEAVKHFAPLHIPQALAIIRQAQQIFSQAEHFACFDTAFHITMPEVATRFPLPGDLYDEGVQRYGFHGLSYASIVHRLQPNPPHRAVFAHLGSGSSLVAVRDGESIDTTMGLTPTGGIPMATRSGDLDPGVLIYLLRQHKLTADKLETLLNHDAGLKALSGGESDMRTLLERAQHGDAIAELAIQIFTTEIQKRIGAYAAVLGGLDLLVFTGGIGENSGEIRQRITTQLTFLGLDEAKGTIRVLPSEEEIQIARHTRQLL
jgi:acetate kinase